MANRNNKVLQIRLPQDLIEQFAKYCADKNISMSEYIRRMIEKAIGYEVK